MKLQMICNQCPRRCNAIREANIAEGFCGMPSEPVVARADLHLWEEPCISGSSGSGTIFFSGCVLKCVFCQNSVISTERFGKKISINRLAQIMKDLEDKGAHNINFVTPTHYVHAIKDALKIYTPKIPLVYNCGGYEDLDLIKEDVFDIYLFDLKYLSSETSLKYSLTEDYFDVASRCIKLACEIKGKPVIENGIMKSGVIIRHLLLPNHTKEAIAIIDWAAENCPQAIFSLMSQFIPINTEKRPEIDRRITEREYKKVSNHLLESSLEDIYLQELESAQKSYIPNFNLLGI